MLVNCDSDLLQRLFTKHFTYAQGCAVLREDQIKLVMGPDNRPTGEAFVEIAGPGANLALALAKDRQVMPVRHTLQRHPRALNMCCRCNVSCDSCPRVSRGP